MRSAHHGDRPHGLTMQRRRLLQGGLAVGLVTITGCASDAGRAQLLAARPLLRTHAQLLADVYAMQSADGRALTIDDVPGAVADLVQPEELPGNARSRAHAAPR